MRGDVFTRQLRLLQLLESRKQGVELDEAATELGTGRRTLYRDFEVLERSGVPLLAERDGKRARWRILEGYRHRMQLGLTWSELLALGVGNQLLGSYDGTLLHESARSALDKVRASLPRELLARWERASTYVSARRGGHDYRARSALVSRVVEAIESGVRLETVYRSRGPAASRPPAPGVHRKLDPYHLHAVDGALYLVGHCHHAGEVRTFLLDRFERVQVLAERFSIPPGFEAAQLLSPAFGMWLGRPQRVRFTVAPPLAHLFLERKVHPSQVTQTSEDGAVEVELNVAVGPPLVAFLAGLGGALQHVAPMGLRKKVLTHLRSGLRQLSAGGG